MSEPADLWERVTAFANLRRAALVAARSKRTRPSVARFLFELEPRCFALRRELRSERWRPGHAQRFTIHDPKRRTISAAPSSAGPAKY